MTAGDIIKKLNLIPHPEGGYYKETYRCEATLETDRGRRNISTAIYYLLENNDKSNFHRIQSDELWFFHQGNPLQIFILKDDKATTIDLGNDISKGEIPQAMVPANSWFASKVKNENGYSLVSCTVAPGFDFRDFEMAERKILIEKFPQSKELIEEFTHS